MSRKEFGKVPYGFTLPPVNDRGAGVDARLRTQPAEEEAPGQKRAMSKTMPAEDEAAQKRAMPKTMPAEDEASQQKPAAPKAAPANPEQRDARRAPLVVGWIVGVQGECRGRDFRLHSGMNAAGCGDSFAIALNDERVGQSGPAFCVSYDPMNVKFLISPGSGSCLCYINGEFLAGMCELYAYDRIQLRCDEDGETPLICELVFVPLCGAQFFWQKAESEA